MTPAGIEPATFRFLAQHLNHCATVVPFQIYIPNQKHGLSSNLRKEVILGVVGTSTSDLFDHDMPLDCHFSFLSSLLWCALLFSVCGSNTMLKAQRDVRVNTFPERIALNISCTVCNTTVGFCTTVQRMTPGVIAQQS